MLHKLYKHKTDNANHIRHTGVILFMCLLFLSLSSCADSAPAVSSVLPTDDASTANASSANTTSATATATAMSSTPTATADIPTPLPTYSDDTFVKIIDFVPSAVIELKYATNDNFTGEIIYNFNDAYARYGTVKKLMAAADAFEQMGFRIKIWDAYRPVSAQFRLWEVCPDPTYVANPNVGYSNHTRGCAIDLTLINSDGVEILMPTAFDDFSLKADRDYSDVSAEAAANARLLQSTMESCGFSGYYGEWWHFNDSVKYSPETSFEP